MIKNISYINNYNNLPTKKIKHKEITFKGGIQTLTHTNIGSCLEGYIGKVRVRKKDGFDYLNVFKHFYAKDVENYTIQTDKNEIVGNVTLFIIKRPINPWENCDPSHVFVEELRNFSRPGTPEHNNDLEYYKDIGTRLLQIAQRRSDEARCNGNIRLVSKNESMDWYMNVIGMRQEHPVIPGQKMFHNPNTLYLPPESKEPLSRLQGGL